MFKAAITVSPSNNKSEVDVVNSVSILQLYHHHFGHQGKRHIISMVEHTLKLKFDNSDDEVCKLYILGKSHNVSFKLRNPCTVLTELQSTIYVHLFRCVLEI